MKLYRLKIPEVARDVIKALNDSGMIEVSTPNVPEAEKDLEAIMEEYLRRDNDFRNAVKNRMASLRLPHDTYSRVRREMSAEWNHPTGKYVESFLARQFIESFMVSKFVDEVYEEDKFLIKKIKQVLIGHNVDESEIADEAKEKIKNIAEGTIDYEIALSNAIEEVKRRKGLIK